MDDDQSLVAVFDRLLKHFGPQAWWPAQSVTEVVVGAILTQNTAWTNVERAIENLKQAGCMDWVTLQKISEHRLAELIQPAGTFRIKARRLKIFVAYLFDHHEGSLDSLVGGDLQSARQELLSISGVGPETADAILLYAGQRPTFVVDAYTKRILRRHQIIDPTANYDEVRRMFLDSLPNDGEMFNEYHALFVELGKRYCRTQACCDGCPLDDMPHDATL